MRARLICALLLAPVLAHADSRADSVFRAGVAADLAGHPERAYVFYRLAAEAGQAEAEFDVAVMNDSGVGVARDQAAAALWYARAAAHGFTRAAYDLGELAAAGDGVPRNVVLARNWFDAAGAPSRARTLVGTDAGDSAPTPRLDASQVDQPLADGTVPIELVWQVSAMPVGTQFFVQMVRLDATGRHDIAWTETPVSALLVPVSPTSGLYAWRVLASSPQTGHYTMSSWASFRLGSSTSLAAAP